MRAAPTGTGRAVRTVSGMRPNRTLALAREALSPLDTDELGAVAGGGEDDPKPTPPQHISVPGVGCLHTLCDFCAPGTP